jgi:hypothetical protein
VLVHCDIIQYVQCQRLVGKGASRVLLLGLGEGVGDGRREGTAALGRGTGEDQGLEERGGDRRPLTYSTLA